MKDQQFFLPKLEQHRKCVYNARDLHLVVGNKLIESPSHIHSRYLKLLLCIKSGMRITLMMDLFGYGPKTAPR